MMDFQIQRLNNRPLGSTQVTDWEITRWVGLGAILLALILAYAWLQTEIVHVNYQIDQLQKETNQLRENNTALRVEHSSLISPNKINRQARELGLVSSNRAEVRILESETSALDTENLMAELLGAKKILDE